MSIITGAVVAFALTACTSAPGAKNEVKIPTFSSSPTSAVPLTTSSTTTTEEPVAPVVEPPSLTTQTPKPPPPKTTPTKAPPPPPSSSSETTPPPPTTPTGPFVRLGAPCQPEGAIGITRDGALAVCRKGFPDMKRPRWRRADASLT
jgi:hypothetical protein